MEKLIKDLQDLIASKDRKIAELEKAIKDSAGIHNHYHHYHNTYTQPQWAGTWTNQQNQQQSIYQQNANQQLCGTNLAGVK